MLEQRAGLRQAVRAVSWTGEGVGDLEKLTADAGMLRGEAGQPAAAAQSVARPDQLERLFAKLFDEAEFLSPHGLRALSAYHRDHPYEFDVDGYHGVHRLRAGRVDHVDVRRQLQLARPGLVAGQLPGRRASLERYHRFYGDDLELEYPTGSGKRLTLDLITADLQDRLISLFTRDANGRRPCFGGTERMQTDPAWKDNLIFSEYFHGDNGAAIGAFHQTGWTGLIADLILRRHGAVRALGDVLRDLAPDSERVQ